MWINKIIKRDGREVELKLLGKALVLVDWANVYRWRDSLKKEVDAKLLYKSLKKYGEIKEIHLYHGEDDNEKSKLFLIEMREVGYKVISKPVKYVRFIMNGKEVSQRKCDFDLEIGLDCFENIDKYDSFVILSGDGDYATLYERLIGHKKQVIVVYASAHLGREIWQMKKGIFKIEIDRLLPECLIKNVPRVVKPRGEIEVTLAKKGGKVNG